MKLAAYKMFAAVVVVLTVSPALAQERQTPGSQIQVSTCSAKKGHAGYNEVYTDSEGKVRTRHISEEDSYLKVYYRNTAAAIAREVDFGLVTRDELVERVKDVGTFSPGVLIEHKFKVSREIFPLRTALPYCAVLGVRYEDGRVWENPQPPKT